VVNVREGSSLQGFRGRPNEGARGFGRSGGTSVSGVGRQSLLIRKEDDVK
jgi:hypothetical protein